MSAVKTQPSAAQIHFENTYITSAQIMRDLNVSRSALLYARKRGLLPDPIVINDGRILIWEKEHIQANIDAWKIMLDIRKGA
jgi:hypothetical protein